MDESSLVGIAVEHDDAASLKDELRRARTLKLNRVLIVIVLILVFVALALFVVNVVVPYAVLHGDEDVVIHKPDIVPEGMLSNLSTKYPTVIRTPAVSPTVEKEPELAPRVFDPLQPEVVFKQEVVKMNGKYMLILFQNNLSFSDTVANNTYTLNLEGIEPVSLLTLTYTVENVTVHKSIKVGDVIKNGLIVGEEYNELDVTYPNPDASLILRIYDADDKVVSEEGYGGRYDARMKDVVTFLTGGDYRVEIEGRNIIVDIMIAQMP